MSKILFLLAIVVNLMATVAVAGTPNVQRGRLLHENHCTTCHESQVHIRANHRAHSLSDVYREVVRWSNELQLNWDGSEINDVSHYLYLTFYADNVRNGGEK